MRIDFVRYLPPASKKPVVECFINDKAAFGDFIAKAEAAGGELIIARRASSKIRRSDPPAKKSKAADPAAE